MIEMGDLVDKINPRLDTTEEIISELENSIEGYNSFNCVKMRFFCLGLGLFVCRGLNPGPDTQQACALLLNYTHSPNNYFYK